MKKFFVILISLILFAIPVVYADGYDTNVVIKGSNASGGTSSLYKYWAYYKTTGTRYVIRVYDWNSGKFVAVPKKYYINHISSSGKQVMYLGVDKTSNSSYKVVKSGSSIFTDNTYAHIIKWFDNSNVKNFGLTKNDVNLLAGIVRDAALKNNDTTWAKNMQNVIDGIVPYDVRAEILFLMKMPGTKGSKDSATVTGKGSIENYSFTYYDNKADSNTSKSDWRQEYLTYLEIKAIAYDWTDDCGIVMKSYWLDKVACALYERHPEYVFVDDVYQCSCDLYRRKFGSKVTYSLSSNKIKINQGAYDPNDDSDRRYMYYTPGRCGIPIKISGTTYYLTPGQTYNNLNGKKVTLSQYTKYSDTSTGIKAHSYDYLNVVTKDATRATIYEGWDYITNNMAATLVIACDKDTGNIITLNDVTYSEFKNVGQGTYNKTAWDIDGYTYLGYISKNDLSMPNVPLGIQDSSNNTNIVITDDDVNNGTKKQIIFVYEKTDEDADKKQARISIYNIKDGTNTIMFSGKYTIDDESILNINLYDNNNANKYSKSISFDLDNGYKVNNEKLEEILGITDEKYEYVGSLVKVNPEYFLTYLGEELQNISGDIYNLKYIGDNKVHIILGYKSTSPEEEVTGESPQLKISYVDDKGNPLPNKSPVITDELTNKDIVSKAEDMKKDNYMYIGYTYTDTKNEFGNIVSPLTINGKEDEVTTKFVNDDDRRHIAFIYKKIEIKFEIDVVMKPDDLQNQLIGQKDDEDYWVLDEAGKVVLKVTVTGTDGLNILGYNVKLRIPFDTYMNGSLINGNSINNLAVTDLSEIIIADRLITPIWVKEDKYDIEAIVEANVEGFGIVSANKKDDIEVVGRLYDFTVTNLDGSSQTGDEKWKGSLFGDESNEYKASSIPVGQIDNQPEKYNYGIKLGTTFYFSINTKGIKNNAISIVPKFLYVSEDGKTLKDVDIYFNENGKIKNILDDNLVTRYMKLRDDNILKQDVVKEVERAQQISKVLDRYKYSTADSRSIGKLSNIVVCKYLSLPYLNYINEFKNLYGTNAISLSNKTGDEILTYASHWYGKYVVPMSSKIVDKGASYNSKEYKDGYLVVCFKIISIDANGNEYLSYDLPSSMTQWQKENLNQLLNLPRINKNDIDGKTILLDTLKDGYAPTIIYQVGITTKDNVTSAGTH